MPRNRRFRRHGSWHTRDAGGRRSRRFLGRLDSQRHRSPRRLHRRPEGVDGLPSHFLSPLRLQRHAAGRHPRRGIAEPLKRLRPNLAPLAGAEQRQQAARRSRDLGCEVQGEGHIVPWFIGDDSEVDRISQVSNRTACSIPQSVSPPSPKARHRAIHADGEHTDHQLIERWRPAPPPCTA